MSEQPRHARFAEDEPEDKENPSRCRENDSNGVAAPANVSDGDDSDGGDIDDEEALEREKMFQRVAVAGRGSRTTASHPAPVARHTTPASLRRYNEYSDFLTRSERARQRQLCSTEERRSTPSSRLEKVTFSQPTVSTVLDLPELTDKEKAQCYMTSENWSAIDLDVELTKKRWDNHTTGRIPFDTVHNTIRGLEHQLFLCDNYKFTLWQHQTDLLKEVNRQKREGTYPDWEAWRKVSMKTSQGDLEKAARLGQADQAAMEEAWKPPPAKSTASPVAPGDKHRKNPLRGIFRSLSKKK